MSFLNMLEKLRSAGADKWSSLCPVHDNKTNRTLTIKQNADGSYVCHCFSCGANGLEVFNALGLPLDELFGGRKRPEIVITQKQIGEYEDDYWFIALYENSKHENTHHDYKRYKLAKARMTGIDQLRNKAI